MRAHVLTYIRRLLIVYVHTYKRTYPHTHLPTYVVICIHTYVCQRTVTPQPKPASRATQEAAVVQQLHASIVDRSVRRRRPAKECLPVSPLYICVVHPPLVCKTCQIRLAYAVRISSASVYSCIIHSCTYPRNRGVSSRT